MPRCFINCIRGYKDGKYWVSDGDNRNVMTTRSGRAIPKVPAGKKKFRTGVTSCRVQRPVKPADLDSQKVNNQKVILYRSMSHVSIVTRFQLLQDGVHLDVTENPLDMDEVVEDSPLDDNRRNWGSQSSSKWENDVSDEGTINGVSTVPDESPAPWIQSESTEDCPFYLWEDNPASTITTKPAKNASQKQSSKKRMLTKSTKKKSKSETPAKTSQSGPLLIDKQAGPSEINTQKGEVMNSDKSKNRKGRKSKSDVKKGGSVEINRKVNSLTPLTDVVRDLTPVEQPQSRKVQTIRAKLDALLAESLTIPSRFHQAEKVEDSTSVALTDPLATERIRATSSGSISSSATSTGTSSQTAPSSGSTTQPSSKTVVPTMPIVIAPMQVGQGVQACSNSAKHTFAAQWTPRVILRETDVFKGETFAGQSHNPPKPTIISTVVQPDTKKTLFTIGLNTQCSPVKFTIHPSDLMAYKRAKQQPDQPVDNKDIHSDEKKGREYKHPSSSDASPSIPMSPNPSQSAEADLDKYLASSRNILKKETEAVPAPKTPVIMPQNVPNVGSPVSPGPSRVAKTPKLTPGTPRILLKEVFASSPSSVGMRTPVRRADALSSLSGSQSSLEDPTASPISSLGSPARSLLDGRSGTDSFTDESGQESEEELDIQQLVRDWHSYGVDSQGQRIHRCTLCLKVFTVYAAYRSHATTHIRARNRCPVCSKVFSRSWLLKGHMRVHTGEKPYRCRQTGCDKAFADKSNLRSHMLIHTTTGKSYVCSKCNRAFAQKRYLHKHKLEVCKI